MPYITREDGERFVIPSYRDVLTMKQKSQLKKEILALSQNYGEYITMQKKGPDQFELAFSPDPGYLLGESVWQHFNRPADMIYCEVLPNSTDAILVIVKAGAVYLDGSFAIDSIPEELIIFLTQQNNFEIFVYGDVPISKEPEPGKFSFEASAVKSFTVLEKPAFPQLPLLKMYQLQLVAQVLKTHGIGALPIAQIIGGIAAVGILWVVWSWITSKPAEPPPPPQEEAQVDPFQGFYDALETPAPDAEVNAFVQKLPIFFTMTGWYPDKLVYAGGSITAQVKSTGGSIQMLYDWAKANNATVGLGTNGFSVTTSITVTKRPRPKNIYPVKILLGKLIDKLAQVYPGNQFGLGEMTNVEGTYKKAAFNITIASLSPSIVALIGDQFKDMPITLESISIETIENGSLTGTISITVLGS